MKPSIASLLVIGFAFVLVMAEGRRKPASADEATSGSAGVIELEGKDLNESSGLAFSLRRPKRFWSHNDSGGKSRLFAFDVSGRETGRCNLKSTDADDWEAMAAFIQRGIPRLLVADCGDNDRKRGSIKLYVINEPDPDRSTDTKKIQKISVKYQDGPRDCEAVAVDAQREQIILIAKSRLPAAGVYVVSLPDRDSDSKKTVKLTARRVGTLAIPMITGLDVDPISGDIWVINYFQAFHFACADRTESIGRQLARTPQAFELPRLKQVEAVAIDRTGKVWVTSEGSPTKLAPIRRPVASRP